MYRILKLYKFTVITCLVVIIISSYLISKLIKHSGIAADASSSCHKSNPEMRIKTYYNIWDKKNGTFVSIAGNLTTRMNTFQNLLAHYRYRQLNFVQNNDWIQLKSYREIVDGNYVQYIYRLLDRPTVTVIGVNWTEDSSKDVLPIQRYFKPLASAPFCDRLKCWEWEELISCNSSIVLNYNSEFHIEETLGAIFPKNYAVSEFFSYVSIVAFAAINNLGSVASDQLTILPATCRPTDVGSFESFERTVPNDGNIPVYDEVFIISQYWGEGYYHVTVENLPRLAPYVEFLRQNVAIKIHMINGEKWDLKASQQSKRSLEILGINPDRVVYGNVRAKLAYLPRSAPCGYILLPESQILATRYHKYIEEQLHETEHSSVVLIVRMSRNGRSIPQSIYDLIEKELLKLLSSTNLKLEIFSDANKPSHSDTLRMFYRARMVIGVHGAGLANIIYSRAGTLIFEMVCQPPVMELCYASTAGALGHKYHAFPVTGCPGTVTVDTNTLIETIQPYINLIL